MNNFKATIGIEIHTELNTKSKMFSSAPVSSYDEVNVNINEVDLGLPGVLPSPNKMAVIKGIQLATALGMKIDTQLCFDRKNYYYQDLSKGFQITQQYHPIGKDGKITIDGKTINIERIHLEEDTAKQQTVDGELCLDYNRCGVPLIEIVSKPDIETPQQAVAYLIAIKRILVFLNISDGRMEDGSFRADVNISVAPIGSTTLGTKVEIKNINSFANVAKAIDYEFNRQLRQILKGELIEQETRRWDEAKLQTVFMRLKSDAVDYHYFREPNIVEMNIENLVTTAQNEMGELPDSVRKQLVESGVANNIINQLLDDYSAYKIFKYINNKLTNPGLVVTWIIVELPSLLKMNNGSYDQLSNDFLDRAITMLQLLINQEINGKQAKTIFEKMYLSKKDASTLIKELGFEQIKDTSLIENYFKKYIESNKEMVDQYKERPERVEKFFIGLLMRDTKGQANPNVAIEVLKKLLH
ncbi:MAG: Asp-tRNA(Asn)/Glu-tRNA(Gln) amidotransferase subunit GatB [Mycoplasmataceae bacterium]|nr:Asp-tRNA(Asn)/Glu-tRNA(Gln) amidotransferase subunit GatB [Mycoplasmataceae bacterium]